VYTPSDDVVVRKNLIVNCTGWAVQAYSSPKRQIITHNILAGSEHHGALIAGPDALVAHNVFYRNNRGGVFFFRSGCVNASVVNNLFFEATALQYDCCGDRKLYPSGNKADHNFLAPGTNLGEHAPQDEYGPHNLVADPMVVNAELLDFRLRPGSPCMGGGKAPGIGLFAMEGGQ
jgi:hypothetical protein